MTFESFTTQSNPPLHRIRPISAFNDNYIWLIDDGQHACVVDPGDAKPVMDLLEAEGLKLTHILLTHHHHDHVGGVEQLVQRFNAHVWGPAKEVIPCCDEPLNQGDVVTLDQPNLTFNVLDIPGHTAGHIAFVGNLDDQLCLFCGDTLFAGGCGRLFEGTAQQLFESLRTLACLPDQTKVYCAHEYTLSNLKFALAVEPDNDSLIARNLAAQKTRAMGLPTVPSTIALEKSTNPFLRSDQPTVVDSVIRYQSSHQDSPHLDAVADPVQTFATLRQWKNHF